MDKVDKTKENIGISNLDDSTKKDLFDRFQKAGGQVIDERTKRRNLAIDRNSQKALQRRLDGHRNTIRQESQKKKRPGVPAARQAPQPAKKYSEPKGSAFARLMIRVRLSFYGIAEFSALYFKLKFLEKFNNVIKPAIMELQMVYLEIFRKNPKLGNQVIQSLDKADPIYYELIVMVSDLYDKMIIDQIVDQYINFPDVPKKVSELKDQLMSLYRRLYILRRYQTMILTSFEKAIDILQRIDRDGKISGLSSMKRKVRNNISILYYRLIPKLHWLFCYYYGKKYDIFDTSIETILAIKPSDKPGSRKRKSIEEETAEETEEEAEIAIEDENAKDAIPDHVKSGLKLMYELNLQNLRKDFDKYGRFSAASEADKVLICYLLFHEFDNEYSVILTTNKVKYNVSYSHKGMVDYRNVLRGLYDEMRKCEESFKNYTDILDNFDKMKKEKPASNAQYIEYTKRLEILKKKRNAAGRETLRIVQDYSDRILATVEELVQDFEGQHTIVENPQDVLLFESHIEGLKKLNGKKVYDAILTVYQFVSALSYRLGPEGDLSGSIEFKPEEMEKREKSTPEKKAAEVSGDQASQSVLDELDDML
ncbi:MAG: hypothetical protein JXA20_13480 [Spirochaetes bacterium]|nr:hypothetical protein [Spirochaetota bacterium]